MKVKAWVGNPTPFTFPCHCEEALAEADMAIQMGRGGRCPMIPLDCRVAHAPRNDNAGGGYFRRRKRPLR